VPGDPRSVTDDDGLVRVLGLGSGVLFVLGSVIGSGIFLTTGVMAAALPSATLLLVAWASGGALALAGGLTYAELGAMFPKSGGVYVYLREAFGPLVAFLYGWAAFLVFWSGGIAAVAVGFAEYLKYSFPDCRLTWPSRPLSSRRHQLRRRSHWKCGQRGADDREGLGPGRVAGDGVVRVADGAAVDADRATRRASVCRVRRGDDRRAVDERRMVLRDVDRRRDEAAAARSAALADLRYRPAHAHLPRRQRCILLRVADERPAGDPAGRRARQPRWSVPRARPSSR
jgi:hypothetical protein